MNSATTEPLDIAAAEHGAGMQEAYVFAASYAQQRLWFLDQLRPGNSFYNIPTAVRLEGPLHEQALHRSLQDLVQRHEVLRTRFAVQQGVPMQVVLAQMPLALALEDLSAVPDPQAREGQALASVQREAQAPFDLAAGPLMRARLIRLGPQEHLLVVTLHHIVSDGWSQGVLVQELARLYEAHAQGQPPALAELPLQYADYAHWQRQWLAGEVLQRQLAYWTQRLHDAPAVLELPTDRPRPAVQTHCGATHRFSVAPPVTAALHALGRAHGATLFMTLAAAFNVLLARYSGQHDLCVGTPIANRTRGETEGLIGLFVNTLVLRSRVDLQAPFLSLLQQVKQAALEAYAHQDVPFEQLVEAINPPRSLSHAPLFQVMLVLQNAPRESLQAGGGLVLKPIVASPGTARFDLTVSFAERDGQLDAVVEYSTDLFDAGTIERLGGHLGRLLQDAAERPGTAVGQLALLTPGELAQIEAWSGGTAPEDGPGGPTVHALFEARAAGQPQATAVVFEDQALSYGELDERAGELARVLRAHGVGPDVRVALCLERSIEMIVALLAVLKAGGAYVPLDPAYPRERLAGMLQDAAPQVLLTHAPTRTLLPALDIPVLLLDQPLPAPQQQDRSPAHASADHLAYVIYTSGSTGRPKGVAVSHRGLCNLCHAQARAFQVAPASRVLQFASTSFDAAASEIFVTLAQGAALHLCRQDVLRSPDHLLALLAQSRISIVTLPPSLLALMSPAPLPDLATLVVAGEPCPVDVARRWAAGRRFVNAYGPTEATVCATWNEVRRVDGAQVSIGRPLDGVQVHILDGQLNRVPAGVPGEICLGGAGVARGYLHRPGLTGERFLPDPHAPIPGARMYRTGDRARFLEDGSIEFLGRMDQQVKLRGYRIELGEIEAVLGEDPQVGEVVTIVREDHPGDRRIVAYVCPTADSNADPVPQREAALRAQLQAQALARLPDYMRPAAYVFLDALPATPAGKLDRHALPPPDYTQQQEGHVAPAGGTEELVAAIWCSVLQLERVGATDNFFQLGGHSLLATQVVARIRQQMRVDLPLRAFFDAPTVAALARAVDQARRFQQNDTLPELVPVPRTGPLPLSFAQQRIWFLSQLEPESSYYNVPVALRLSGALDAAALARSVAEIVRRHEPLRTTFAVVQGQPVQVVQPPQAFAPETVDLCGQAGAEEQAAAIAHAEAARPFRLEQELPLRVKLLRVTPAEHLLLLTQHHIATDGWSTGVLVREFAALYTAFRQGLPSPLPELPVQYADHAHWHRAWLSGSVRARQEQFWTGQLAGAPALTDLPTDHPRPAVQGHRGSVETLVLGPVATASVRRFARAHDATLYMVLLGAFSALLQRYTGQRDLPIGTAVANRTHAGIENLIGFFVNTLVMRIDADGDSGFQDLLARVRTVVLDAYAHQDLPFEHLVDLLKPQRSQAHSPLFQVFFVLQNAPAAQLQLPDLVVTPAAGGERQSAKFDLSLFATEAGNSLHFSFEYNTDLFEPATVRALARCYVQLLEQLVAQPGVALSRLPLDARLARQAAAARERGRELAVQVAASFTADPLRDVLEFWMAALRLKSRVSMSDYGLVLQELLDPGSALRRNAHGVNIVLLRPEDALRAVAADAREPPSFDEALASQAGALLAALEAVDATAQVTTIVCCCPPSSRVTADAAFHAAVQAAQARLREGTRPMRRIVFIGAGDLLARYPVARYEDAFSDEAAHLPYTEEMFAGLGTTLARAVASLVRPSCAVLVVDDEVVAGADADLRAVLREQHDAGRLLCRLAPPAPPDAAADAALAPAQWVAVQPASGDPGADLEALSGLLGISLERFVYLARSEVRAAGAQAACPEALVLALPEEAGQAGAFVRRIWALDHFKAGPGAREATAQCRRRLAREAAQNRFLAELGLEVVLTRPGAQDAELPGQLIQHTHPFNLNPEARPAADAATQCWLIDVTDRFGAHGVCGCVVVLCLDGLLHIEGWTIDSRMLGRGVEQRVLGRLLGLARDAGCSEVQATYIPTAKNQVVRAAFAGPHWKEVEQGPGVLLRRELTPHTAAGRRPAPARQERLRLEQRLSRELRSAADALEAVRSAARRTRGDRPVVAARTATEAALARIWAEVLNLDAAGVLEDFFDLGGHSLSATQLGSRIYDRFTVRLPLRQLFEHRTIAQQARLVEARLVEKVARMSDEEIDALLEQAGTEPQETPT